MQQPLCGDRIKIGEEATSQNTTNNLKELYHTSCTTTI